MKRKGTMRVKPPVCDEKLRMREEWAKERNLKRSKSHDWIRLTGKRGRCWWIGLPADDHCDLWLKDGKPYCYTSQPYHLYDRDMRDIIKMCDEYDLTVHVSALESWHYPGGTMMMVWKTREQYEKDQLKAAQPAQQRVRKSKEKTA